MYNPFSLVGKTILVTGASSGIGRATAIECSKMGAKLIISGRNEENLNETFDLLIGDNHSKIVLDLLISDSVTNLVNYTSVIDGLVLCAGIGKTSPFQFCDKKVIDEVFNINFYSQIELLRLIVKSKKLKKESSVVFVSSIGGVVKFNIGNSVYSASKAAINAMMKVIALELSNKKIRVNSVNPGMVDTKLLRGGSLTDEQLEEDEKKYPLKRYGQPKDIALSIIYLLSDASSWVTGTTLIIDGGNSI